MSDKGSAENSPRNEAQDQQAKAKKEISYTYWVNKEQFKDSNVDIQPKKVDEANAQLLKQ